MTRSNSRYLYLLPALFVMAAVLVYPLMSVLLLSLEKYSLLSDQPVFLGLGNYAALLVDERFRHALFNTVYFTVASVGAELLLGLGVALLLRRPYPGVGMARALVLIPWAVPTVVSARMWEWLYNVEFGLLNYLIGPNLNWLGSPSLAINAAIVADVWKTTPFVILLLLAGLQAIPRELYQAAAVDGASRWDVFWRITLPQLKPLILIVLIFRTIDAFRVFDTVYVLTGGGPGNTTETLSIYAYKTLFQALAFGYGSALAVATFACVAAFTTVYVYLLRRSLR